MKKIVMVALFILASSHGRAQTAKESKAYITLAMSKTGAVLKKNYTKIGYYSNMLFQHVKVEEVSSKQKFTGVSILFEYPNGSSSVLVDSDEIPNLVKTLELIRDTKSTVPAGTTYEFQSRSGMSVSFIAEKDWVIWMHIGAKPNAITQDLDLAGVIHGLRKAMAVR